VLLDATYVSSTLSGPEQQVRRWFGAARLVGNGGRVCVVAESNSPTVQALVRYDTRWFAERQIAERTPVGLPPVSRVAELTGPSAGVSGFVSAFDFSHRVLGPVPVVDDSRRQQVRTYVLAPRSLGGRLTDELNAAARRASTGTGPMREVRVRVDPRDM
jgi:primosomal protein N' (replication factor Y)